jgi:hypothetical protein
MGSGSIDAKTLDWAGLTSSSSQVGSTSGKARVFGGADKLTPAQQARCDEFGGGKLQGVGQYTCEEQEMIVMAGSLMHDLQLDLDSALEIIRDPGKRQDSSLVDKLREGTSFSIQSLAGLIYGTRKTIEAVIDEDSWRLFNVSGVGAWLFPAFVGRG